MTHPLRQSYLKKYSFNSPTQNKEGECLASYIFRTVCHQLWSSFLRLLKHLSYVSFPLHPGDYCIIKLFSPFQKFQDSIAHLYQVKSLIDG